MNNTKSADLPQRLSESAFRRFEECISVVVRQYPTPTTFYPRQMGYSPITFSCRLRDSMYSFLTYKWTSPIDYTVFKQVYNNVIVSHKDDKVIVGRRPDIKSLGGSSQPIVPDVLDTTVPLATVHCDNLEVKRFLCELASKHLLAGPLNVTGIAPSEVAWLEDNFDVVLKLNEKGDCTLL